MKYENNLFFRLLEIVTAFFQLNILWLLFCLPVVTIFPATVAMYCVTRQWIIHKDYSVFRSFMKFFKENFKQSFVLGLLWLFLSGLLFLDFSLMRSLGSMQTIFFSVFLLIAVVMLITTVFIFPIMAHYEMKRTTIVKNSFFFSLRFFLTTILAVICIVITGVILYFWPISFIFIFSTCAFCISYLCNRVFQKIQNQVTTV
ncbi:YesL family protein [Robertmurraya korlensis]|uniref:YesL family protein n=1 Tax=Robertmurraya korlensis TaxID=519977 RepID=UPI0008261602|nr:DUF624 domain-containing protein [Robertmurraya korlensis]